MKNLLIFLLFNFQFSIFNSFTSFAQTGKDKLPEVDVKKLDGSSFNTKNFENDGKPIIIDFWATWCKPCVTELTNISDVYPGWKKETGVKIIAISIDDARNTSKVAPFVNGKNWDFEVYLDPNGDLKRAMNVNTVSDTFLLHSKKEIIWQHNSYAEGDEDKLYEMVKKEAGK